MTGIYLDTSALGRVLLGEPDKASILRELAQYDITAASGILRVELHRLAFREGLLQNLQALLAGVALVPVDDTTLATAVRLRDGGVIDTLMTFDRRLAAGAEAHGLTVVSPT